MSASFFSLLISKAFPLSCCSCGKLGSLLCDDCYNLTEFAVSAYSAPPPLESITVAVKYSPSIQKLIHKLKFVGIREAGLVCARLIYYTTALPEFDIITSVPLHYQRQKQRGYNQSEVIALELSKLTHKPYQPLLERQRATKAQALTISRSERQQNLKSAIKVVSTSLKYQGLSILVVDDVWTTGSTLATCAEELQKLNPKAIHGVVVASRG